LPDPTSPLTIEHEDVDESVRGLGREGPADGTLCRLTERTIAGNRFSNDNRTLWGWFDCTQVGLPA